MKHWSHLTIFLLALLALLGASDCTSCLGEEKHTYLVLRCEGPAPGKLQVYKVEATSQSEAKNDSGTAVGNPLNKNCSQSTDGEGRPFTIGESVVYAQVGNALPSSRQPQTPVGKSTSSTATPAAPSLVNTFPFLAPLVSNPSFTPADAARYPSTCTSAVRSYLVNHLEGTVTAFGLCPLTVLKEIAVAIHPLQLAITPDGSTALVTSYDGGDPENGDGALVFIDTATNSVKATLVLTNYNPQGIAISPDGTRAYLTHYLDVKPVLLVIDVPNRKLLSTIPLPQPYPRTVVMTPDGSQVWVNYLGGRVISVVDLLTGTVGSTISLSQPADRGIAFNRIGTKAYVAVYPNQVYSIDTATLAVRAKITVGNSPNDVASTPDGTRIFVTSDVAPGFWWIDPTTDQLFGSWNPPGVTGGSMGMLIYQ